MKFAHQNVLVKSLYITNRYFSFFRNDKFYKKTAGTLLPLESKEPLR